MRDAAARWWTRVLTVFRGALRRGRRVPRPRLWRRSLALRAVTSTVVLGVLLLSILGTVLTHRISNQLADERSRTAQNEAAQLASEAQNTFDHTDKVDYETLKDVADQVIRRIVTPGEGSQRRAVLAPAQDEPAWLVPETFSGLRVSTIPPQMRAALTKDPQHQQVMTVPLLDAEGEVGMFVLVGSRIQLPAARDYDLVIAFPMEREQRTLSDVQNSLLTAAFGVLGILILVSFVATRLIVAPLRSAARTASALADGDLDVRMAVKGEDDLARLGVSFNTMADSLRTQIRTLEHLSQVQQRFVSDVSHELRTPLTTIRMASEVLVASRASFEPPLARSAELLSHEVTRFEALLADLLEISRIDAGAAVLDRDEVDIAALVAGEIEAAESLIEENGTAVTYAPRESPLTAEVDARRIRRVVRNLLVNGIEHSEGRPMEVQVAGNDSAVSVVVRDFGVGLTREQVHMVFVRFWRADPARNRTTGGTGLGLAIALEDTQVHRGWLQCTGQPGRGATFRLTVPRVAGGRIERSPLPIPDLWPSDHTVAQQFAAGDQPDGKHSEERAT